MSNRNLRSFLIYLSSCRSINISALTLKISSVNLDYDFRFSPSEKRVFLFVSHLTSKDIFSTSFTCTWQRPPHSGNSNFSGSVPHIKLFSIGGLHLPPDKVQPVLQYKEDPFVQSSPIVFFHTTSPGPYCPSNNTSSRIPTLGAVFI